MSHSCHRHAHLDCRYCQGARTLTALIVLGFFVYGLLSGLPWPF